MKINTTAKEVHKELEKLGVYPWQYQDYNLVSLNYNVVISDIETYWNAEARFREGFKVDEEKKEIYVPNFFTKVNGVHNSMKDYENFVVMLKSAKNTVIVDKEEFPYWKISSKKSDERQICTTRKEADDRGREEDFCELTIKNLLKNKFFIYEVEHSTFGELTSAKQKNVFSLIERVIEEHKSDWTEEDMLRFVSCCMNIPESIIITLNNFDYNFDVPKVLYMLDTVSESTAMYLYILNELGFDILILEPSGKNTIEKHCDINELSLGYFVNKVEFDKIKTVEEKKKEEEAVRKKAEAEKKKKKKERNENIREFFSDIFDDFGERLFVFLWYIATIGLPIASILLWINVSGMLMFFTCLVWGAIVLLTGLFLDDSCCFDNEDLAGGTTMVALFFTVVILLARGLWFVCTDDEMNRSTHTHDGFCEINEEVEEGANGILLHYRKDAVGQDGYHTVHCYIENNAGNTEDIYFIVKYGNKIVYESSKIEPMEYCPKIDLNNDVEMPIGTHELQIEFYRYDDSDEVENKYTDELIGSGTISYHVFDSSKEVREYRDETGLDYCHN